MKTILVHLEVAATLAALLDYTMAVARSFESYVEALHLRPGQPEIIAAGADGFVAAAPDLVAGFERDAKARADLALAAFARVVEREGLARPKDGIAGLSADWRVEVSSGPSALGSLGRVFDLVAVGRPQRNAVSPSMAALESALFEAGRPVLVVPANPPATVGQRILVAWNGSTETARTVGFVMPFLTRAQKVSVVCVEKGSVPGPSAAELALQLRRHGIDADWREVPQGERGPGQAFLTEARQWGADLMVKGAYTQSRLRQMIFGGATSHILAEAELPVLLAN